MSGNPSVIYPLANTDGSFCGCFTLQCPPYGSIGCGLFREIAQIIEKSEADGRFCGFDVTRGDEA